LENLRLEFTAVTDVVLKELATLKELRTLILDNIQVTDTGLKELAGLKQLKALHLSKTKVTKMGIADLKKVFPGLSNTGTITVTDASPSAVVPFLGAFTFISTPGGTALVMHSVDLGR
jgi:hypothetical protein